MEMEYEFYAEQKYIPAGVVVARVLTAAEAAALHYEDGLVFQAADGKVYVDGFYTERGARAHLADLYNCKVLN